MSQLSRPQVVDPPRDGLGPASKAANRRPTGRRRLPLNFWEEIYVGPGRDDEPPTILLEARVVGSLDEARLREAIAAALAAHPMTRARLATTRFLLRRPTWEIVEPEAIDLDSVLESTRCDDDAAMDAIRGEFCSRPIDLDKAPGIRALLVHRSGGDSFLLSVHHAISDGIGSLRIFNSIARNYAGRPDPTPDRDPLESREIRDFLTPPEVAGAQDGPPASFEGGLADEVVSEGESGGPGYGVFGVVIPAEECSKLDPRPYGPDASLNDLLLAALHATIARWNADRGRPCGRIAILVPVNSRPAAWSGEVVANIVYTDRNLTTPADRESPGTLVAAMTAQMKRLKLGIGLPKLFRRPRWAYWFITQVVSPLIIYRKLKPPRGSGLDYSAALSNLGRIERKVSDFGPGGGAITAFCPSPPTVMPMGVGLATAILGGRLHITLRYRLARLGKQAAQAFLMSYVSELKALGHPEA